jgi:hypothetical protein
MSDHCEISFHRVNVLKLVSEPRFNSTKMIEGVGRGPFNGALYI